MLHTGQVKIARLPLALLTLVFLLFAVGNVLGWVTNDPQSAGDWGGGGAPALLVISLSLFTFAVIGCLVASSQPQNPVGWILIAVGFSWALDSALEGYAVYGLTLHPGSLPGAVYADALDEWLWIVSVGLMATFLFQLFPDGRPLTPRWRWLTIISAAALVATVASNMLMPGVLSDSAVPATTNPFGVESLAGVLDVTENSLVVFLLCAPASAVALLVRFWRSRGVERLQMKWLASATAAVVAFYAVVIVISGGPGAPTWLVVLQDATIASFCLIPLAIGAAVLRYRLYEIDVIVRRTVIYTALLGALAAIYLGGITAIGWTARSATGQSGTVAVTLSTLLVALSFQPLRHRIQSTVDRRFYRNRYDTATAVTAFEAHLRTQTDLEALQRQLLALIDDTIKPTHTTIWLKNSSPRDGGTAPRPPATFDSPT